MALTVSKLGSGYATDPDMALGNRKLRFRVIAFDSSYPTGGESLTAADFGLKKILNVTSFGAINDQGAGDSTKTLITRYNHSTSKLQAFWQTDPGAAGGAAIAFPEVTNTTDLSTYSCRVQVVGY